MSQYFAGLSNQLLLPSVTELSEIFDRMDPVLSPAGYKPFNTHTWEIPLPRKKKGWAYLSSFCDIRGLPFDLDVDATPSVINLIKERMMINDMFQLMFQIIIRPASKALIMIKHQTITTSRYLAMVDASQVKQLKNKA